MLVQIKSKRMKYSRMRVTMMITTLTAVDAHFSHRPPTVLKP